MDFRSFTRWFSWMHLQEAGEQTVLDQSPALQVVDAFSPGVGDPVHQLMEGGQEEPSELPTKKVVTGLTGSHRLFFSPMPCNSPSSSYR